MDLPLFPGGTSQSSLPSVNLRRSKNQKTQRTQDLSCCLTHPLFDCRLYIYITAVLQTTIDHLYLNSSCSPILPPSSHENGINILLKIQENPSKVPMSGAKISLTTQHFAANQ